MKRTISLLMIALALITGLSPTWAQDGEFMSKPLQVTLFGPLGTNGTESANCINNLSWNILWGLNAGVKGLEFGGIGNSISGQVRGAQIAGIFNHVGGDVFGFQASGLVNFVKGNFLGVQIAEFGNLNRGDLTGIQIAGFLNQARDVRFLQTAGFMNHARDLKGIQMAGFLNHADDFTGIQTGGFMNTGGKALGLQLSGFMNICDDILGLQGSGFMNIAEESSGLQAGGFMNVTDELKGAQVAGFMNVAGEVKGLQLSGFLNVATDLKGVQLGVLNVCDTVSGGVPIGLLNIVKKGAYKSWEFGVSECWTGQFSYRLGIDRLYSLFSAASQFHQGEFYWGFGFGLGSRLNISDYLSGSLEAVAYNVKESRTVVKDLDLLTTVRLTLEGSIGGGISWFAGPTFNLLLAAYQYPDDETIFDHFAPWTTSDVTSGISRTKTWPGLTAGIRF